MRGAFLLFFALMVVAACSSAGSTAPTRLCTPGNNVFCRCADRREGTKLCNGDGTGFATECRIGENLPCDELPDAGAPAEDAGSDAPSLCGNAAVDTGEACDDGNQKDGDLCSAHCDPVGDPVQAGICPGMPVHLWGGRTIEISGATAFYQNTHKADQPCAGKTMGLFGNDRVYAVTTHRNGTVVIDTSGADFDAALFVQTDCALASTEVTCADLKDGTAGEHLELPMKANETRYVFLDGKGEPAKGTATIRFSLK